MQRCGERTAATEKGIGNRGWKNEMEFASRGTDVLTTETTRYQEGRGAFNDSAPQRRPEGPKRGGHERKKQGVGP